jgi:hypothetical protein
MHNAVPTYARDTVDSEVPQHVLVTVDPCFTPDAWEACLETLHSSAEVYTCHVLATSGLLHVLGVPLAPEGASALQLQHAKLSDDVVFTNYKGLAHTVSAPDKALAK